MTIWQYLDTTTQCLKCFGNGLRVLVEKKLPRQAKQHDRQVWTVMPACNPQGFKLSYLFDKVIMQDSWLTQFENIRKAGTVKSYCHSLRLFYRFLNKDEPMEAKVFFQKLLEKVIAMDG